MLKINSAVLATMLILCCSAWSLEIPREDFLKLSSAKFHERESAQKELLDWARKQPEPAMAELYQQSRSANDPEVRERCLSILRELVYDAYSKEGEGYVGILPKSEVGNVPGDPKPRGVIRVAMVQPDTPAHKADIRPNDLIVGLNQDVWYEADPSEQFRGKIKKIKPSTKVEFHVLREGALIHLNVILARRPVMADHFFFNGQNMDMEAAERTAKEAYFQLWLNQRKQKK